MKLQSEFRKMTDRVMEYDRDIERARWALFGLLVGNLWAGIANFRAHNWTIALACGIWACNVLVQLVMAKVQQKTRDRARVLESGLHAMRHDIETGEF
jgi:small-conductance mechanosensitive channel